MKLKRKAYSDTQILDYFFIICAKYVQSGFMDTATLASGQTRAPDFRIKVKLATGSLRSLVRAKPGTIQIAVEVLSQASWNTTSCTALSSIIVDIFLV